MKAFILAAGLGTRLRPWTLSHPKALVPVEGVPMLQRVIERLIAEGFNNITVNVHHFAEQIEEFLARHDFNAEILVSDERESLLDTGGALLKAASMICADDEPVLVHNVDILSNAPLRALMAEHKRQGAAATLLTSGRDSSRRLVFDSEGFLKGWHNLSLDTWRPEGFLATESMTQEAFSGIHVISAALVKEMAACGLGEKFSIIDYYLLKAGEGKDIRHMKAPDLTLLDIGKPDTLAQSAALLQGRLNRPIL